MESWPNTAQRDDAFNVLLFHLDHELCWCMLCAVVQVEGNYLDMDRDAPCTNLKRHPNMNMIYLIIYLEQDFESTRARALPLEYTPYMPYWLLLLLLLLLLF